MWLSVAAAAAVMCVQVVTAPITAFVGFIVDLIVGMFLWPKRLTVSTLLEAEVGFAQSLRITTHLIAHAHTAFTVQAHSNAVRWPAHSCQSLHKLISGIALAGHTANHMQVPILGSAGWVFPKEDPVIDLEVERLAGRQQGVIRVHVISAKELKSYDTLTGEERSRGHSWQPCKKEFLCLV